MLNIREEREALEEKILSPYAAKSSHSKGREKDVGECDIRTVYQRDRDRILHSKAFRRLKHKTQVFLAPEGDHYRTRLTHTLEVSQIARTIARALLLNEDLTEAIALGHDLGHTPFGHTGERALDEALRPFGHRFHHAKQSVRVVERLERGGEGLNLTYEVRDGIRNHGMSGKPETLEGAVVRLADKIAYINHDIDDAIRAGVLREDMIPREIVAVLGESVKERLDTLVHSMIEESRGKNAILLPPDIENAMFSLRAFMFREVYTNAEVKQEEEKVIRMLKELYTYFLQHNSELPGEYLRMQEEGEDVHRVTADYIAGMTDHYSVEKYMELFVPSPWKRK